MWRGSISQLISASAAKFPKWLLIVPMISFSWAALKKVGVPPPKWSWITFRDVST